jgi:hypothetical protein
MDCVEYPEDQRDVTSTRKCYMGATFTIAPLLRCMHMGATFTIVSFM